MNINLKFGGGAAPRRRRPGGRLTLTKLIVALVLGLGALVVKYMKDGTLGKPQPPASAPAPAPPTAK